MMVRRLAFTITEYLTNIPQITPKSFVYVVFRLVFFSLVSFQAAADTSVAVSPASVDGAGGAHGVGCAHGGGGGNAKSPPRATNKPVLPPIPGDTISENARVGQLIWAFQKGYPSW